MLAGGSSAATRQIEPLAQQVAALRAPRAAIDAPAPGDLGGLLSNPLFPLTTGPSAVPQPTIRLDGVARAGRRSAALLSINDQPSDWLSQGESRDGVTLLDVSASRAVVDTLYGPREVRLGQRVPEGASAVAGGQEQVTSPSNPSNIGGLDEVPPGFRSPPPPASAPRGG